MKQACDAAEREMSEAIALGRLTPALGALRAGLNIVLSVSRRTAAEWFRYGWVPFLELDAGAIAALHNAQDVFDLMESAAKWLNHRAEVGQFRDDAAAIAAYRVQLARTGSSTLSDLRSLGPGDTRRRAYRLLNWMEKNSEIAQSGMGGDKVISWGAATKKPHLMQRPFREGREAIKPTTIFLSDPTKQDQGPIRLDGALAVQASDPEPLSVEDRQPGVMKTHMVGLSTWLTGRPKKLSEGTYETPLRVIDAEGRLITSEPLPYYLVRLFTSPLRKSALVLDSRLNVHIHDADSTEHPGFSLAGNPEADSVLAGTRGPAYARVRHLDLDPRSGEVIYSVGSRLFWFTASGEPVAPVRFLEPNWSLMQFSVTASFGDSAMGQGREVEPPPEDSEKWLGDWVYFAQFSARDDNVYVGLRNWRAVRIDRLGRVVDEWPIAQYINSLREYADYAVGAGLSSVYLLKPGGDCETIPAANLAFQTNEYVVGNSKRSVSIFRARDQAMFTIDAEADIKAVYLVGHTLRIDMATKRSQIDLAGLPGDREAERLANQRCERPATPSELPARPRRSTRKSVQR